MIVFQLLKPAPVSAWKPLNFVSYTSGEETKICQTTKKIPGACEHSGSNWTGDRGGVQTPSMVNIGASVSVQLHQEKQRERMPSINSKILILDGLSSSSLKCKIRAHFQAAANCKSNSEVFCRNCNCGWASLLFSICHFHFDRKIYHKALIFNLFLLPNVYYHVCHFDLSFLGENFIFNGYLVKEIKSTLRVYFT